MQEYYLLTRFLLEGRNSLLCMIMLYATDGINILEMHWNVMCTEALLLEYDHQ